MQLLKFDLVLVTASLLDAYNKLYQSSVASINTWTTACFYQSKLYLITVLEIPLWSFSRECPDTFIFSINCLQQLQVKTQYYYKIKQILFWKFTWQFSQNINMGMFQPTYLLQSSLVLWREKVISFRLTLYCCNNLHLNICLQVSTCCLYI